MDICSNDDIISIFENNLGEKGFSDGIMNIGKGHVAKVGSLNRKVDPITDIVPLLIDKQDNYPWGPVYPHDEVEDKGFFTDLGDRIIAYNDSKIELNKTIYTGKDKSIDFKIKPKSLIIINNSGLEVEPC